MEREREVGALPAGQTSDVQGEAAEAFSIGELINERYSVVARISEGPTGKLYRAQDLKTASEVTLKLLHAWSEAGKALFPRLREELSVTRTLARTQSAIAQVYGCDETPDGRTFVMLERLEGRNLAELIRWREPLSVERALDLTLQVARGLHAAHSLRLVHGALGAEHVFVQPDDIVKILGFEVARHEAANRASAHPPSERRDVLTEAADTRAVAMLLLEMLTSAVRPGPNGAAPHPEAPRGGEVPPEVKQLVMGALVTSPGPSFLDMGGLVKALYAELRRRREPPSSRAWQRVRRSPHRRQWTLIGARVFAVVASASAGWVAWSLVAVPRPPATHEMPPHSAGPKITDPASSPQDTAAPPQSGDGVIGSPPPEEQPIPPARPGAPADAVVPPARPGAPADAVVPPARVKAPPRAESPAIDQPSPVAPGRGPLRPREMATRPPSDDSARTESDAPDPSAIIDWLLRAKGS